VHLGKHVFRCCFAILDLSRKVFHGGVSRTRSAKAAILAHSKDPKVNLPPVGIAVDEDLRDTHSGGVKQCLVLGFLFCAAMLCAARRCVI